VVELRPYAGKALKDGHVIAEFQVKSEVLFDEVRAGGRIPLIIGRGLTARARESLGLPATDLFRQPQQPKDSGKGYSLAQKMVGRACGTQRFGLSRVFGGFGDAIILSYRRLSKAS